jgi:hypothetical protein
MKVNSDQTGIYRKEMFLCQNNKCPEVVMYMPSVWSSKNFVVCTLSDTVISTCRLRFIMCAEEWFS